MKNLQAEVAHKLNVEQPLKKYLKNNNDLIKTLNEISYDVKGVDDIIVNLRTVSKRSVIMNNHKIVSSFGYISNLASLHSYLWLCNKNDVVQMYLNKRDILTQNNKKPSGCLIFFIGQVPCKGF